MVRPPPGKSTLARALQNALPLPFWHISIDHLRDSGVLPSARFKAGDFDWRDAKPKFFDGYHRSLAAYASAGNHLIVEHILDQEGMFEQLVDLFAPFDVFFVAVHCRQSCWRNVSGCGATGRVAALSRIITPSIEAETMIWKWIPYGRLINR